MGQQGRPLSRNNKNRRRKNEPLKHMLGYWKAFMLFRWKCMCSYKLLSRDSDIDMKDKPYAGQRTTRDETRF